MGPLVTVVVVTVAATSDPAPIADGAPMAREGYVWGPTPGYERPHDLGLAYCVTFET